MKEITLTQGKRAIVDDDDYDRLSQHKWLALYDPSTRGFKAAREVNNTTVYMHSVIMGVLPGKQIDHKNLDTLDNRKENLRHCTAQQNACNRNVRLDNRCGYKGVQKRGVRFRARIGKGGSQRLGLFDTIEEAARAYNEAALRIYGEFARLNEVKGE